MRWMGKRDGHDDDPYGWLAFPSLRVLTPLYGRLPPMEALPTMRRDDYL